MTFDSSNTIHTVPLAIIDDEADEHSETFSASISFPELPLERVVLDPDTTVVEIQDNDGELVATCIGIMLCRLNIMQTLTLGLLLHSLL